MAAKYKLTPEQWMSRIREGEEWRNYRNRETMWKRHLNWFNGEFTGIPHPINLNYAHVKGTLPRVYFDNPRVRVTSPHPGMYWESRVVERLVNMLLKMMDVRSSIRSQVQYTAICGLGPAIFGFDTQFSPLVGLEGQAALALYTKRGRILDVEEVIKPGLPWYLDCRPFDFVGPWGLRKWREAGWIAHRVLMPLEKAKNHPQFEKHRSQLKPSSSFTREGLPLVPMDPSREKYDLVELYEIKDLEFDRHLVVSEGHEGFLRNDDNILGNNFEVLQWNATGENCWPVSDLRILDPQQYEANDIRAQARAHRIASNLRFIFGANAIDAVELDKFMRGAAGVGIRANSPNLRDVVLPLQPAGRVDLLQAAPMVARDAREVTGMSSVEGGEVSPGRHTATEIQRAGQGFLIRIADKRAEVAAMLERVVWKILNAIFTFWNEERIIEVIGPLGLRVWIRWRGMDLRGPYIINIDPESSLPVTLAQRKQEAFATYTALKAHPGVNQIELIKRTFGTLDWLDIESMVQMPQGIGGPGTDPTTAVPVGAADNAYKKALGPGGPDNSSLQVQMHSVPDSI